MSLYAKINKPLDYKAYDKLGMYQYEYFGYDGAALYDSDGTMVGFTLSPNQIKSATNNNGDFDKNNLNIKS